MRIALFGTGGSISRHAFDVLRTEHEIAVVVVPALLGRVAPWQLRRMLLYGRAALRLRAEARRRGIPALAYRRGRHEAIESELRRLAPEVSCVATFPFLFPATLIATPRHGTINLHTSLLPRHRGPDPLFWTYFHDDAHAGVTVHWLDEGMDTGPILARKSLPLARGRARRDLQQELAIRGARLLADAVRAIEASTAPRVAQDESRATREPLPSPGRWTIDFAIWPAERVWHFLSGLGDSLDTPLPGVVGPKVRHGVPCGFGVAAHDRPPGSIGRHGNGWRLWCRDGFVDLAPAPTRWMRGRAALRRFGAW